MTAILSIQDLNTTVNHEPRVQDITIAERLGYERPRVIRELIARNKEELERYGEFAVRYGEPTTDKETPPHGGAAREGY